MRNGSREKESMRGGSGFAQVEVKLSTNAACCTGLANILSLQQFISSPGLCPWRAYVVNQSLASASVFSKVCIVF